MLLGHGAANVTLGIPRLREIVMTASQKPKTPSMTMKVRRGVSPRDVSLFCKRVSRITLSQIVDNVIVHEQLRVEHEARRTQFTVNVTFYPKHEYQEEHDLQPAEILAAFGVKFPLNLKKEMMNEMKKLDADLKNQMAQLGHGKKVRSKDGEAEEEDDEPSGKKNADQESEAGDGDADEVKHSKQKKQQATYDSDDEDDGEEDKPYDDAALEAADASDDHHLDVDERFLRKPKSMSLKALVPRISGLFQRHFQHATAFDFDESQCTFKLEVSLCFHHRIVILKSLIVQFMSDMPKLLFVGIVERACRGTVVREIPAITDCFQTKDDSRKGSEPEIKVYI